MILALKPNMQIYGPKRTRKRAKKGPKIPSVANLTPALNSTLKITIETGLRPFYSQKNNPDAYRSGYRLQSRVLLLSFFRFFENYPKKWIKFYPKTRIDFYPNKKWIKFYLQKWIEFYPKNRIENYPI